MSIEDTPNRKGMAGRISKMSRSPIRRPPLAQARSAAFNSDGGNQQFNNDV